MTAIAQRALGSSAPRIGKYRLIAHLGEGGQASVYLALVTGPAAFNKLIVVKVLRENTEDPSSVTAFLQEARLAAQLNHANVVQTYEIGEDNGVHFIAMEYIQGRSLGAINRRLASSDSQLPLPLQLRILVDVAHGLHHAHTLKSFDGTPLHIVHRDVSPQNVMITYGGHVKLLDFGIAKAHTDDEMTRQGVIKGKIAYMPPEQLRGQKIDHRADIFPLGVMLWQAITGKRFAGGTDVPESIKMLNRLEGKEPKLRDVAPETPVRLVEICDRALALDPEDRQATAEEFAHDLSEYLAETSRVTSPRKLADIVSQLFERERRQMDAIVEEQVRLAKESPAEQLPLPDLASPSGTHTSQSMTYEKEDEPFATGVRRSNTRSRMKSLPIALGAAGALALALGAFFAWPRAEVSEPALTPTPPVTNVTPPAATGEETRPAPTAAEPADRVRVRVSATPESAVAQIDGAQVSLPLQTEFRRDSALRILTISAPGYQTERRVLTLDRDVELTVNLTELAERPIRAAAGRRSHSGSPTQPAAQGQTSGASQAPAASPAAPPRATPEEPTTYQPRIRPAVDTEDPYR